MNFIAKNSINGSDEFLFTLGDAVDGGFIRDHPGQLKTK